MKLSIAIITYNRSAELIRAIESCTRLLSEDYEIQIWDNASETIHADIIRKYVTGKEYIHYHYSSQNRGVAGGRNAVWECCIGEYVFFLDDDAVVSADTFFSHAISYMDTHYEIGAIGVDIDEPSTGLKHNCLLRYVDIPNMPLILNYMGGAHFIRKSVMGKRLYPEHLHFGSEEIYVGLVLWNSGYCIRELSDLRVTHLPNNVSRYLGKKRDINILVNIYVVKKLTYPVYLHPIIFVILFFRLFHNRLSLSEAFKMINERYDVSERNQIKARTIYRLIRMFGIKSFL